MVKTISNQSKVSPSSCRITNPPKMIIIKMYVTRSKHIRRAGTCKRKCSHDIHNVGVRPVPCGGMTEGVRRVYNKACAPRPFRFPWRRCGRKETGRKSDIFTVPIAQARGTLLVDNGGEGFAYLSNSYKFRVEGVGQVGLRHDSTRFRAAQRNKVAYVFIYSIDRAITGRPMKRSPVSVRMQTQHAAKGHHLGPRVGASRGRLCYSPDQSHKPL